MKSLYYIALFGDPGYRNGGQGWNRHYGKGIPEEAPKVPKRHYDSCKLRLPSGHSSQ